MNSRLKRYIFAFIAIPTLVFGLVCCKDEDKNDDVRSIVGTWYSDDYWDGIQRTYSPDGTFIENWRQVSTGTYQYGQTTLTLYYSDGNTRKYLVLSATGNSMELLHDETLEYWYR